LAVDGTPFVPPLSGDPGAEVFKGLVQSVEQIGPGLPAQHLPRPGDVGASLLGIVFLGQQGNDVVGVFCATSRDGDLYYDGEAYFRTAKGST